MDIEGTFSNTPFPAMTEELVEKGVDCTTVSWVDAYLGGRTAVLKFERLFSESEGSKRLPSRSCSTLVPGGKPAFCQGNLGGGRGVYTQGYADGICILRMGHFSGKVTNLVQGVLQRLEERCELKGLSVNDGNSDLVVLERKQRMDELYMPTLFGQEPAQVRCFI